MFSNLSHLDTIITINENPFHGHEGSPTPDEEEKLHSIRRNLANVFEQLSKVNEYRKEENPINALSIRSGLPKTTANEPEISEAPSLLFHYLFDDWYTSYSLVAKQEHQYGKQLGNLVSGLFLAWSVNAYNPEEGSHVPKACSRTY